MILCQCAMRATGSGFLSHINRTNCKLDRAPGRSSTTGAGVSIALDRFGGIPSSFGGALSTGTGSDENTVRPAQSSDETVESHGDSVQSEALNATLAVEL